jgi:hypothetical protein
LIGRTRRGTENFDDVVDATVQFLVDRIAAT